VGFICMLIISWQIAVKQYHYWKNLWWLGNDLLDCRKHASNLQHHLPSPEIVQAAAELLDKLLIGCIAAKENKMERAILGDWVNEVFVSFQCHSAKLVHLWITGITDFVPPAAAQPPMLQCCNLQGAGPHILSSSQLPIIVHFWSKLLYSRLYVDAA
jgi:hypothetical protein